MCAATGGLALQGSKDTGYFGWPMLVGMAWLACAHIALELTQGADGIAAVWPSSGIFIAALLLFDRRHRMITAGWVALASMASNMWAGSGLFASAGYTVANIVEGYLVFALMGRQTAIGLSLARPWVVARYGLSAVIAGCASALMAGLLSANFTYTFLSSWASTVTLGMLLVTPIILFVVSDPQDRRSFLSLKSVWTMLVVTLLSLAAFGQSEMPLLFLPVMGMAVATAVLGLSGAAGALVLIAAVGSVFSAMGSGPVALFFPETEQQVLFFQVYLVALLVSSMPLAYLLAQRERDLARIAESADLLEQAERAAKVGHWRFRPLDNAAHWSAEALNICGFAEDDAPTFEQWLGLHHSEDRDRVRAFIVEATTQALPFAFESRIERGPGEIVHVDCRGGVETDREGRVTALFGTMLDVTERAETMRQLEIARARAEREAAEVRMLAATDPLTGIPNRRCILANLAEAMDASQAHGEPLSVAMIDIDFFKTVNDRFGHGFGDTVIKRIADILASEADGRDSVGRLGGEEFLFIFPGRTTDELDARCSAIREALAKVKWEQPMEVTLSIGIAQLQPGWDERDLMRAADEALYDAKEAGRNRHAVHIA